MGNLLSNVAALSIDVTRILVSLGYGLGYDTALAAANPGKGSRFAPLAAGFPALAIAACTGAGVPIVITTAYPHGVSSRGIGGMSAIVSGVTGNLAANNIDTDPRSLTIGTNGGVLAVPLTATTLALYGQDPTSGAVVALTGSGTYAGGGTIVPALTDGSILLGRDTAREHSAPPRIVMIPRSTKWAPKSNSIPNERAAERRAQTAQRTIRNAVEAFDVMCWGQATPPDPARDYDITRALAHSLMLSAHLLFGATDTFAEGVWNDEKERATQQIKAGHLYTFGVGIAMPVLDAALPYAPPWTTIVHEGSMQTPDGVIETGC